eukprot:6865852-Prymnesium_polylepis.1
MVAIAEKSESKLECEHECKSPVVDADLTRERGTARARFDPALDPRVRVCTPSARIVGGAIDP